MIVLAFDTTSEYGGVAVYRDGDEVASARSAGAANYSVTLFEMADRVLAQAGLALRDVELFAVASGPGSFTGTRVGLAAAQAWGRAFERPVQGVSVLEAMVEEARPETEIAVSVMDARRGELFAQIFHAAGQPPAWSAAGEGVLARPAELAAWIEERAARRPVTAIAREQDAAARQALGSAPAGPRIVPSFLVPAVARVALRRVRQGGPPASSELEACYVRRSDAELNWKDPQD